MKKRIMYSLQKRNVDAEHLSKETFIIHKAARYAMMAANLQNKAKSYIALVKNNCDLPKDNELWRFIDENPEFYEDIRGKISQSVLHLLNTEIGSPQQEIPHNQKIG